MGQRGSQDWDSAFPMWSLVSEFRVHGISNCSSNALGFAKEGIQGPGQKSLRAHQATFQVGDTKAQKIPLSYDSC